MVLTRTVTRTCCTWEGVAETVDGFVHSHVGSFQHWFDALEVAARSEVTAVNNGANVSPFRVHRTGGIDNEGEFDFATAGVIPCDLDVVVCVDHNVWVSLVADDWREKGVIEKSDDRSCGRIWLKHGVVDLWLVKESLEFIIGVFPNNVGISLAVQID